jgi:hypothetical protein
MRDISTKGVFFYSDFLPSVGDELDFVLEFVSVSDNARFHFKGTSSVWSIPRLAVPLEWRSHSILTNDERCGGERWEPRMCRFCPSGIASGTRRRLLLALQRSECVPLMLRLRTSGTTGS